MEIRGLFQHPRREHHTPAAWPQGPGKAQFGLLLTSLVVGSLATACASEELRYGDLELVYVESPILAEHPEDAVTSAVIYLVDKERLRGRRCSDIETIPSSPDRQQQALVASADTNTSFVDTVETGEYYVVIVGRNARGVPTARGCQDVVVKKDLTTKLSLTLDPEPVPIVGRYRMPFDLTQGFPEALSTTTQLAGFACALNDSIFRDILAGLAGGLGNAACDTVRGFRELFRPVEVEMELECRHDFNAIRCLPSVQRIRGRNVTQSCNFFRGEVSATTSSASVYDQSFSSVQIDGATLSRCLIDTGVIDVAAFRSIGLGERQLIGIFEETFYGSRLHFDQIQVGSFFPRDQSAGALLVRGRIELPGVNNVGFEEEAFRTQGF